MSHTIYLSVMSLVCLSSLLSSCFYFANSSVVLLHSRFSNPFISVATVLYVLKLHSTFCKSKTGTYLDPLVLWYFGTRVLWSLVLYLHSTSAPRRHENHTSAFRIPATRPDHPTSKFRFRLLTVRTDTWFTAFSFLSPYLFLPIRAEMSTLR